MAQVKHEFEITISGVDVAMMSVREVLEQSFARRVEQKDEDALRDLVKIILSKRSHDHPLAKVKDPTRLIYSLNIKRHNV